VNHDSTMDACRRSSHRGRQTIRRGRDPLRDPRRSSVPFHGGYDVCHLPSSCVVVLLLKPVCGGTVTEGGASDGGIVTEEVDEEVEETG
jgi:hypothetical protein